MLVALGQELHVCFGDHNHAFELQGPFMSSKVLVVQDIKLKLFRLVSTLQIWQMDIKLPYKLNLFITLY